MTARYCAANLAAGRVLLLLDPELNERGGGKWLRPDAGRLNNARHRLQRRANAVVKSRAGGIVFGDLDASDLGHVGGDVRVARQVHVEAQQARRVDADVPASQIDKRSNRETGPGQEYERERHLHGQERHEHCRAQPPPPYVAARLWQLARGVTPRGSPRRHDPENEPRQHAKDGGEHKCAAVERDLIQARKHAGCEGKKGWKPQPGDPCANHTAAER